MTRTLTPVLAAVVLMMTGAAPAAGQQVRGQKPVMMIGDVFQFNEGSWATYTLRDKKDDSYYSMTMSILETVRRDGKECAWMEIEIETGKELVVTRFLTEKTKTGPGDLFEAIVYVYGMEPFSIPQRMLKDANKQVPPLQVGHVAKRVERMQLQMDGESLDVWAVEGTDPQGGRMSAMVSLGVAPIGVLLADSDELSMYLEAWGGGATTRIKGKPMGFVTWILGQIGKGMAGEDVGLKERPQRAWDVAGVWREFEGPCAGSPWTIAGRAGEPPRVAAPRCEGRRVPLAEEDDAPRWRSDRVVEVPAAAGAQASGATLIFVTPVRAVVWYTAPDGRPAFATLRRSGG